MKSTRTFSFLAILIFAITAISCENDESSASKRMFFDPKANETIDLTDQAKLNELAKRLSGEKGEFKILTQASLVDLVDSKGSFKAISIKYQVGELITKMIVPVNEVLLDEDARAGKVRNAGSYLMLDTEACEMKCTATYPCSGCTQEIIERCKSQTCACTQMAEGCAASIVFND